MISTSPVSRLAAHQRGVLPGQRAFDRLVILDSGELAKLGDVSRSRLLDKVTFRWLKTTDAIQCPLSDNFRFARQLSRMLVGSFGLAAGLLIHLEAAQRLASGRLPTGTMM
jgi:hypothetical protein